MGLFAPQQQPAGRRNRTPEVTAYVGLSQFSKENVFYTSLNYYYTLSLVPHVVMCENDY
jgi:hypothetical protein